MRGRERLCFAGRRALLSSSALPRTRVPVTSSSPGLGPPGQLEVAKGRECNCRLFFRVLFEVSRFEQTPTTSNGFRSPRTATATRTRARRGTRCSDSESTEHVPLTGTAT
eukprot:1050496-Rhodomonas_salina.2